MVEMDSLMLLDRAAWLGYEFPCYSVLRSIGVFSFPPDSQQDPCRGEEWGPLGRPSWAYWRSWAYWAVHAWSNKSRVLWDHDPGGASSMSCCPHLSRWGECVLREQSSGCGGHSLPSPWRWSRSHCLPALLARPSHGTGCGGVGRRGPRVVDWTAGSRGGKGRCQMQSVPPCKMVPGALIALCKS